MICVSLGRTRHRMVIAEHQALARKGAQLVELRIDWLARKPDLGRLLKERPTAVVITCRRPEDGGRWRGDEETRQILLRQAIVNGVDYVDLELDVARKIPRYGPTKRIISYHNFQETPHDLQAIWNELREGDPDIIKLVTMANSPQDNVRILQLAAGASVPTIAFCMGELGVPSRVLCGKYGAPFTYGSFSRERLLAPGQLTFEDLRDIYRFDAIDADTEVYGVLGDPIAQSWSPLLHNRAFQEEGINAVYLPLRVPADELRDTLAEFEWLNIRGYSVTIPHKEAVAAMVRNADASVSDSGAANTLFHNVRGAWCVANTDMEAALSVLRDGLTEAGLGDLSGKRVLLLGAGGVGKAIGLGLTRAGSALTITNRHKDRGRELAEQLNAQFIGWENRGSAHIDILVNCTPVGMFPNVDETPFPQHWLRDGMVVFDTVYNPETTLLLREAKAHMCVALSGLEMFVRQAAAQFECFLGRPAPIRVMRDALRKAISPIRMKEEPENAPEEA